MNKRKTGFIGVLKRQRARARVGPPSRYLRALEVQPQSELDHASAWVIRCRNVTIVLRDLSESIVVQATKHCRGIGRGLDQKFEVGESVQEVGSPLASDSFGDLFPEQVLSTTMFRVN